MKINKKLLMAALASAVIVSAPQAKAYTLSNAESVATNTGIGLSEEKAQAALRAPQEETEPNYAEDEKNVGFYKDTQLERGNGPAASYTPPDEEDRFIDGFRYKTLEPSETSPDQTKWGIEVEFDRNEGQRTYTDFFFSNSGNLKDQLDTGKIPANAVGEALDESFKEVNYKSESEIYITKSGRDLRSLNLYADKKELEHINSINNKNTVMAWEGHYKKDNPSGIRATQGSNSLFGFTVNPWPNENDMLNLIYLNGDYDKKVFVQGQTIETGIKVENLDENARERLVGQVYHPVSGKVVPGAEAYIDDNGNVYVKMPEGALKLAGGKYVVNEDSIFFKDPAYKGLTHLDVKFFARPRKAEEFKAIVDSNGAGYYTPTGADTEVINHKGQSVTIDKQGIDRYDHYNLIGGFNINLDDTRYYDQEFKDEEGNKIDPNDSTSVSPGKKATIRILDPSEPGGTQKTGSEMDAAYRAGEATGKLKEEYLIAANKKIARELGISYDELMKEENKDKRWVIDGRSDNISYFDITAPKNSKAGDTIALPVVYTYTNGSTDTRWFHFVVQESTLNKPEYSVKVDYPSEGQKSQPELPEDPDKKKLPPKSYSIPEGTEFKDDKRNEWTVSIDETTGVVTAKPLDSSKFDGGETLTVPVIVHYEDEQKPGEDITEETKAEFVIKERANMTPRYNAKAGKEGDKLSSAVILDEEDKFNRRPTKFTINTNAYKDDKGNTWKVSIDEKTGTVTATVPDGENINGALVNVPVTAHYYDGDTEKGTRQVEVQFIASGTKNTIVHEQEIPFETKVEVVDDLAKGEWRYKKVGGVELKGKAGSKKTTYTIKDSKIVDTQEETIDPENAVIEVGGKDFAGKLEYVDKDPIPFETEVTIDPSLAPNEIVEDQAGVLGEQETKITRTITNGEAGEEVRGETTQTKNPVPRKIRVGAKSDGNHIFEEKAEVPFEVEIQFDDSLKPGEQIVSQEGVPGEKTRNTTLTIENGKVIDTNSTEFIETKAPVKKIIKVGRNTEGTHSYEEKIPFKYNISYDPNLKSGEYVIDVKGTEGTKKTTWTIKNSQIVGEPKVETTDPVNAVIRVGKKDYTGEFSHEVTEKIPFSVKVIEDNTIPAGQTKVDQEGQPGSKTTKYTQAINNGEADGELKSEETARTEPVERVIRVGTKPANNDITVDSNVKVEIKYTYDPNLDKGVVREGTFTQGSVKTVVTNEYDPVTGEIKSVEKTVVVPPTQEIIIGTKNYTGEYKYEVKEEIPFETEIVFDDTLDAGTKKVVNEGKLGEVTKEITQTFENGDLKNTSENEIGRIDPEKRVIKVGSKTEGTHEYKEEIPFKYTVVYDPEMKAGTYEEVTPGKVGERVTIWTIKNSKIVGEPTVVETKPIDAVIKVGSKDFTGSFETQKTDFIEFETIYEVDSTMEPGTTKVVQEGQHGETEITVTHTIKNGEVTESKEGKPKQTKAAVNRIVKVGAAKSNGNHEYTNKIPFDVEVRVNPQLKKGEHKVVQKGEVGEEKYTLTIEDSKVTNTSEPAMTKSPVKEIIEVGSADFTGKIEYVDKDPIPFETEIIVDPSLAPNQIVEDQKGELGEQETKITRTITNGEASEEVRGETIQTKAPVARKLRIGSKTNGQYKETETIPFEVEVRKDPSLKKGEWKYNEINGVKQTGESGLKERTLTIENSQITDTSEYTTVREPKKAVILVGDEDFTGVVTHTEHFEIPFEVEVRYNSELPAGTSKEIQKGVQGSYDIEFNQKIKNGAPDGDLLKVESNRVDPKKHIIEVGTKVETPENNYSKDVEVEIEYVYDDTKDKGVVETGELTPGKVETKVVDKYNPETGKIEQTTEQVVTKAKQKVIVGTKDFTGKYEYSKTCPIPFEVEIIEDDTLEKGKSEVKQKGVPGYKTTKYEQDIKNGQPDGEARKISEKTTKEPVKHIVRVGTKPAEPTEGETSKTIEREIPYETKVIYDETLESGTQKIENEGKAGKEEVTITQKVKDSKPVGDPTETTKTIIEKEDRVVRVGVKPVVKEVELGNDTEYRHNPELKEGETKVIEEGSKGSVKYTTTFNKETGKLEVTEERVEPKNKVVEYGSKTDGEFTYESEQAFDTKIIEDSNLEAGKTVVDQEGVTGRTKTTVKIENSKKVSENTETLVEKQDKIVRVGTKNVCEIPPVKPTEDETTKTIEREIPYETKVIYDENLEAGFQKIEKEGKPGKEKVTITTKLVDGKLVTTESTETIEDKEDRVVRIGVKPVVKETELSHDTEYRYNPNLKEGEQKVIEEGSNGKVEYTITFNKEKGKIEVIEKKTEPKNKIVEIGYKTDGKVKVESEIPFEIEIIEDPEMEAGKTEVVQEGELGKKETIVTIENSEEVSREEKTIKEPVKKIIKVGTKNVCEIPPVNPDKPGKPGDKDPGTPDKPGDKDPENPDKPGDKDPENPDKPGDKDPENPDKPGDKDPENPDKPGDKDPETPGKPGDKDPENPDQPGDKDPETPGKPGDKDPETPGKPGEDPKDPEQPGGEDPKDPEQPGGEDPKDPEQPSGKDPKDPETPGKTPEENGKTPENNGKTPENNGKTPENNGKTPGATGQVDGKSTTTNNKTPKRLPKSGSESEIMTLAMSGLLTAAGFIGLKKKRKDK